MSDCAKEALWLIKILNEFGVPCRPVPIYGDNKGAMDAVRSYTVTKHTKHIELHLDFMKQRHELGELAFTLIPGSINPADVLTKPLARAEFEHFRKQLGVTMLQ